MWSFGVLCLNRSLSLMDFAKCHCPSGLQLAPPVSTIIIIAKGHEPGLYEALYVIAGPFLKFTTVKLKRTK